MFQKRMVLFPDTAQVVAGMDGRSALHIGGCDLAELANQFDTPLYVYDLATIENAIASYRHALASHYPGPGNITYAGKAFLNVAMARLMADHKLWLDCTGFGELHIAKTARVAPSQILVHGVNKGPADLQAALSLAGTIVVDNLQELERLIELRSRFGALPKIWLRVRPGHPVNTHAFRQTGQRDSKFGMAENEIAEALALGQQQALPITGLHFHQGSHFHRPEEVLPALETVLDLMAYLKSRYGWSARYLCPGGGWGIPYHEEELPHRTIDEYVRVVATALVGGCRARGLDLPVLQVEPGRSLVARAGVAIYTVGTVKQSGDRRWLLLDGGMADNIRPALYQAAYSALPVHEPLDRAAARANAWVAGPYCESGDVLIADLPLPEMDPGELLVIPVSGAYQLMMASNYNGALRPPVVMAQEGHVRLLQRRESLDDLVGRDQIPEPAG